MDCTTKAYQQKWARLKTIFGRYYLVAYSAPPKSNILDDRLDSQITIVSKTAVFLRPRWLVVTFSSRNPFLPSYPLQIFLPGTVAASCSIQNFGPCIQEDGLFIPAKAISTWSPDIWYLQKSMMFDWFTYMTCFPVDWSAIKKNKA